MNWVKQENASQVRLTGSNGVVVTIKKTPLNKFDIQLQGPWSELANLWGPVSGNLTPTQFINNFLQARVNAGDTIS